MSIILPRYIEIETSRLCNRRCSWCPVGNSDDRSLQELMPWELFESIINQLSNLQYEGKIGLTNYNEPLLNPRLLQELKYIKTILSLSKPRIYTNGDYLTMPVLKELAEAGTNFLRVTIYPSNSMKDFLPSREKIFRWLKRKSMLNFDWIFQDIRQGMCATTKYGDMDFEIVSPDIRNYSYRGGTAKSIITNYSRVEPCYITSHSATIDYTGRMKMCCCVFPENNNHGDYILGNLNEHNFRSLWTSEKLNNWRKNHASSNWSLSSICANCCHHSPPQRIDFDELINAK